MARRRQVEWFWQIGSELRSLSEELIQGAVTPPVSARRFWEPRVDVFESADSVIVTAEIAGVETDDINLSFSPDRGALILRGARAEQDVEGEQRTGIYHLEIYYGEFLREVPLPHCSLDTDHIRATARNGFLRITVPKRKEIAERRTIPVVEG